MKNKILGLLAFLSLGLGGCATIIDGKTQQVSFQSTPAGATVLIDGTPMGQTPFSTNLLKKTNQTLVIRKEGYKDFSTTMSTSVNGWFWGNILLGGLLGSTTDGVTGSMHQYAPNQFFVTLDADGSSAVTGKVGKSKEDKLREYVVVSYTQLSADIKAGSGNYLDTLLSQLDVPPEGRAAAISKISALHQAFPDITQFTDHLLGAFVK